MPTPLSDFMGTYATTIYLKGFGAAGDPIIGGLTIWSKREKKRSGEKQNLPYIKLTARFEEVGTVNKETGDRVPPKTCPHKNFNVRLLFITDQNGFPFHLLPSSPTPTTVLHSFRSSDCPNPLLNRFTQNMTQDPKLMNGADPTKWYVGITKQTMYTYTWYRMACGIVERRTPHGCVAAGIVGLMTA